MCVTGLIEMGVDNSHPERAPIKSIQAKNRLADYFVSDSGSISFKSHYLYI